jgi:hypothetical protein
MNIIMQRLNSRLLFVGSIVVVGILLIAGVALALTRDSGQAAKFGTSSDRADLRICVDTVDLGSFDISAARGPLTEALAIVKTDPRWEERKFPMSPTVEVGCPGEPYLLQPGVSVIDGVTDPSVPIVVPRVEEPSVFRLFVFVLPADVLSAVIKGEHDVRTTMQEALCQGSGGCAAVTNGLYLSESELGNRDFLVEWLTKGLSLERPVPQTPDTFQERGNPNSPKPE